MTTTLYDWLGNEIKCPEEIEKALAPNSKEKRKFYDNYVSSLEQIVGFKPEEQLFAEVGRVRSWTELFNWTEREFNHHPFLKEAFNSYGQFFNSFFVHPYGVSYQDGQFVNVLNAEQNKDKKNQKIIEYVRGINLPLLLYLSVQEYQRKSSLVEPLNEIVGKEAIPITYRGDKSKPKIKGNLIAEFSSNYWQNILSSSEDCIFITHDRANKSLVFRDYWFASLGHMFHPAVYYLNFRADEGRNSKELRERFPYPLFKAILMETGSLQHPLLVEGVVGENPHQFKLGSGRLKGVCDFIDLSIWRLFAEKYQKSNPKSELVYFPFHDAGRDKPYSVFDELVKEKYPPNKLSSPKLPLEVICNSKLTKAVSNAGREQPLELFSEAFARSIPPNEREAKIKVGAFVEPKWEVKGITSKEYVKSTNRRYYGLAGAGVIGIILAGTTLGNYLSVDLDQRNRIEEYSFTRIYTETSSDGKTESTKIEDTVKKLVVKARSPKIEEGLGELIGTEAVSKLNQLKDSSGEVSKETIIKGILDRFPDSRELLEPHLDKMDKSDIIKSLLNYVARGIIVNKLAEDLRQICDTIYAPDKGFLPGGISPTAELVCPLNPLSKGYNGEVYERGDSSEWMKEQELLKVKLKDLSDVSEIIIEGKPRLSVYIPFVYEPPTVITFAPAVEINASDGKKYALIGNTKLGVLEMVTATSHVAGLLKWYITLRDEGSVLDLIPENITEKLWCDEIEE